MLMKLTRRKRLSFLFFKKLVFSFLLSVFSITVFGNDGKSVVTKTSAVKFEDNIGIVSGRQAAINKTNTVFNYTDNSIYQIYSKPDFLTTLRLQEGEKILFFAGGDTERWDIEEAQGGKGNRPMVFIKPSIEEEFETMETNINIITDRHTYFLNVTLSYDEYNPLVEWNYPNERKIILEAQERNASSIGTNDLAMLNYSYTWSKNMTFSPVQVFDNGENTFLILKENIREMPAIFMRGVDGQISFVRPKINGRFLTLDRVSEEIILQLGKRKLKIENKNKMH